MKTRLTASLALILTMVFSASALAETKPVAATEAPDPPPAARTAPVATDASDVTASISLEMPTPEQTEEALAVYRRFVALCKERGETISDTAFEDQGNPNNQFGMAPGFVLCYMPMEGVKVTAIPSDAVYYLNINDFTGVGWARHRALWADMMRAIDPAVDAARAAQIIDKAWEELTEAHPGSGVKEGRFEEGAWGYMAIRSPDGENGSMLMVGRLTEPAEGQLSFTGPMVVHLVTPRPEDARVAERRGMFRSLVEALGMELLPDDEPVEAEMDEMLYSCHLVTDTVEWTDLFDPENGRPLAHYVLHKGQDTTKQGVSDLTRGVLQAAIVAAADVADERAAALVAALIDALEEETGEGRLASTIDMEDGRTVVLRADGEAWFVLVSCGD